MIVALALSTALTGCSSFMELFAPATDGPTTTTPVTTGAVPFKARVALRPIANMPPAQSALMTRELDRRARNRRIELIAGSEQGSGYALRGNVSAERIGQQIVLAYNWDVIDGTGKVVARVRGEMPAGKVQSSAAAASMRRIAVQRGDTLFELAKRYRTTVRAIQVENGLSGSMIYAGQTLRIPGPGGAVDPWKSVTPEAVGLLADRVIDRLDSVVTPRSS